jgi:hypothetical protein
MSFCLSSHLAPLSPTRAHWLDDAPDLSCKGSTGQHAVDGCQLSCKQQAGGSSPRQLQTAAHSRFRGPVDPAPGRRRRHPGWLPDRRRDPGVAARQLRRAQPAVPAAEVSADQAPTAAEPSADQAPASALSTAHTPPTGAEVLTKRAQAEHVYATPSATGPDPARWPLGVVPRLVVEKVRVSGLRTVEELSKEALGMHPRAKLTVQGRRLLVDRVVEEGWSPAEAARAQGVSVATCYKWLGRWRAEGPAGLVDRSCRPHRSPRRLSPDREQAIVAWRATHRVGPHR